MKFIYNILRFLKILNLSVVIENIRYRKKIFLRFPVPCSYLRVSSIDTSNLKNYLEQGKTTAENIILLLKSANVDYLGFNNILDFGCSTGRILRHLTEFSDSYLTGVDINKSAINWCTKNLIFANFFHNSLRPPLLFDSNSFDFIYSLSVFTHFTKELELAWISEIKRILKPNGIFLLTLRGESYMYQLSQQEKAKLNSEGHLVRNSKYTGSNYCNSFHSLQFIQKYYLLHFDLVHYIKSPTSFFPRTGKHNIHHGQDVLILKSKLCID